MNIGIAGAGLLGRLTAWTLAQAGHQVSVFDPAAGPAPLFDGQGAAGFTAAGMLSPLAERETAEPEVALRGWPSIERWHQITTQLHRARPQAPALMARHGSLLVAHGADAGAARRVLARLDENAPAADAAKPEQTPMAMHAQPLASGELARLEPALHSAMGPLHAWLLPGEAQIDTPRTMQALHEDAPAVQWHWDAAVQDIEPHRITLHQPSAAAGQRFDWVFDLRGVGARERCAVRGVRGELIWLHAPGVSLNRPVRLLHPRHRVYLVPRPGDVVLVGASELESEDRSPVSLRSAVELMAAAHSVLPALAEARIVRLDVNLRPALPDHRPLCHVEPGLVRINGLYRHGWLIAPSLVDEALARAGLLIRPAAGASA